MVASGKADASFVDSLVLDYDRNYDDIRMMKDAAAKADLTTIK